MRMSLVRIGVTGNWGMVCFCSGLGVASELKAGARRAGLVGVASCTDSWTGLLILGVVATCWKKALYSAVNGVLDSICGTLAGEDIILPGDTSRFSGDAGRGIFAATEGEAT